MSTTDWVGLPGTPVPDGGKAPEPATALPLLPARAPGWNKFSVTVMYAQACRGKMKPEDAVKWAAGELGKVYTGA